MTRTVPAAEHASNARINGLRRHVTNAISAACTEQPDLTYVEVVMLLAETTERWARHQRTAELADDDDTPVGTVDHGSL